MPPRIAVYPGTFDPPTNGHIDVANRAANIFDKLIIGVSDNLSKKPLFDIDTRVKMLEEIYDGRKEVEIKGFSGLLIDFVAKEGAIALVRGLRAVSDFEYELQMASFNNYLNEKVETVFFMARDENLFVSSSLIKEIAKLNGDVANKVHPHVWNELRKKFGFRKDS